MKATRVVVCSLAILAAGLVYGAATERTWIGFSDALAGLTPQTALKYDAEANWEDAEVADSLAEQADFTGSLSGVRYVRLPSSSLSTAGWNCGTHVSSFGTNYTPRVAFIGDGTVNFDFDDSVGGYNGNKNAQVYNAVIYSDVTWGDAARFFPYTVLFCGDMDPDGTANRLVYAPGMYYPISHRLDLYAKNSNPIRVDPGHTNIYYLSSGSIHIYAPQGSDEDVTGYWTITNGSPYAVRTGDAHVLPAGTIVTGDGIPDGTFVKRIFSDSQIELSNAATNYVEGAALTFAAFSPQVTQHVRSIYRGSISQSGIALMKYRDADQMRLEVGTLTSPALEATYVANGRTRNLTFYTSSGYVPGTIALSDVDIGDDGTRILFANCHLELSSRSDGSTGGFLDGLAYFAGDGYTARITVPADNAASIASLSNVVGTLVKDGAGTLSVTLASNESANTGALSVKAGVFSVDGTEPHIANISISSGATLQVSSAGLSCDTLAFEEGAVLSGPGTLTVSSYSDGLYTITCTNGGAVVCAQSGGELFIEPPSTNVVGNPALWVDASKVDSLVTQADGDDVGVTRWNDVRGGEYFYATNASDSLLPKYVTGPDVRSSHVYFPYISGVNTYEATYALMWNRSISGIRAVFKVVGCDNGGGMFLGGSPFKRLATAAVRGPLIEESLTNSYPQFASMRYYANGEQRDWRNGYPYAGGEISTGRNWYTPPTNVVPVVAEVHLDSPGTYANNFSTFKETSKNGKQRIYEMLVYTNSLTEAERLAVTGYLMKKWLNAEVNFEDAVDAFEVGDVAAGTSVGPGNGAIVAADSVSGTGTVTKAGAGIAYWRDFNNTNVSLSVVGGTALLRSLAVTRDTLPGTPCLHLDASDSDTYGETASSGDTTYLKSWKDVRGDGHPAATALATSDSSCPVVSSGAINGLAAIDFKSRTQTASYDSTTAMTFGELSGLRSIFTVVRASTASAGVGTILGHTTKNYYLDNISYGIARVPNKTYSDGLVYRHASYNIYPRSLGYPDTGDGEEMFPGATRTRINGEDAIAYDDGYTGGDDSISIVTYEDLRANSFSHSYWSSGTKPYWGGGKVVGEVVYYKEALSRDSQKKVESYLNRKWKGVETPGYRAAAMDSLKVESGASVAVYGTAPIEVRSVDIAGVVTNVESGATVSFALAANAEIVIDVAADGSYRQFAPSGTVDLSNGGTVVLTGYVNALPRGLSVVVPASSAVGASEGEWTASADGLKNRRRLAVLAKDGALAVNVMEPGIVISVR